MNDEQLAELWKSDRSPGTDRLVDVASRIQREDRAARERERWARAGGMLALALLCPVLLWATAFGKTPLVRVAYALMAIGTAILVSADWLHLAWRRQAIPGAGDARSQLLKTVLLLARQAAFVRLAAVWCAPIFVGAALIGVWLYANVGHTSGYGLWFGTVIGWLACAIGGASTAAKIDARRARMERVLSDFPPHE